MRWIEASVHERRPDDLGRRRDRERQLVYARRFDAAGQPLVTQFTVADHPDYDQESPSVAVAGDGRFVVAWLNDGVGTVHGLLSAVSTG